MRICPYSLFVFDEIDKIPIGLLDVIKAYIDFNHEIDGLDFRNSVFIFLRFNILLRVYFLKYSLFINRCVYKIYSNSASAKIAETTLELDNRNINRNNFDLKHFQDLIAHQIYYNKGIVNSTYYPISFIQNRLIFQIIVV